MIIRKVVGAVTRQLRSRCGVALMRVYSRPLGGAVTAPPLVPDLHLRLLGLQEVLTHAADPELDLRERQVRTAFARGDLCIGALVEGAMVGYTWLAFGRTPHIEGVWVDAGAAARYSYKTFVRSAWRGKRIVRAMHAFADLELHRGRHLALDLVDVDNFSSRAALERSGSSLAGYVGYADWRGWFFACRSPGASAVGINLVKETSRPMSLRALAALRAP